MSVGSTAWFISDFFIVDVFDLNDMSVDIGGDVEVSHYHCIRMDLIL